MQIVRGRKNKGTHKLQRKLPIESFPDTWPMFDFKFLRKDEESSILAIDIDMMIVDGMSTELLIHEIMHYYNSGLETEALEVGFSDYMGLEKQQREKKAEADKAFWMKNIQRFTAGPFIDKVEKKASDIPYFHSLECVVPAEKWSAAEKKLRHQRILPPIYLLTVYARMVSAWTNHDKLTINMTVSDRKSMSGKNLTKQSVISTKNSAGGFLNLLVPMISLRLRSRHKIRLQNIRNIWTAI